MASCIPWPKVQVILNGHPEHGRVFTAVNARGGPPQVVYMPEIRHLVARTIDPDEPPTLKEGTYYRFSLTGRDPLTYQYIPKPQIEGVL